MALCHGVLTLKDFNAIEEDKPAKNGCNYSVRKLTHWTILMADSWKISGAVLEKKKELTLLILSK